MKTIQWGNLSSDYCLRWVSYGLIWCLREFSNLRQHTYNMSYFLFRFHFQQNRDIFLNENPSFLKYEWSTGMNLWRQTGSPFSHVFLFSLTFPTETVWEHTERAVQNPGGWWKWSDTHFLQSWSRRLASQTGWLDFIVLIGHVYEE